MCFSTHCSSFHPNFSHIPWTTRRLRLSRDKGTIPRREIVDYLEPQVAKHRVAIPIDGLRNLHTNVDDNHSVSS